MEAKQIAELELLLEEYRGLVSATGSTSPAINETITKLNDEKEQLTKEVAQMSNAINVLKQQLEVAESKVPRL